MPPVERPITDSVDTPEEEHQQQTVSRRKLLKVLSATGGTVAATLLLPSKWTKPVVEVGVLPVHAQATLAPPPSVTPSPPVYSATCDSTPGGGDITNYHGLPTGTGRIDNITASLVIISGSGSVDGITVTMTALSIPPSTSLPTFSPVLPRTAVTDASGVASFGSVDVTGVPIQYFGLRFSFAVPIGGPLTTTCSVYELH
jgi:hypothetical protein